MSCQFNLENILYLKIMFITNLFDYSEDSLRTQPIAASSRSTI